MVHVTSRMRSKNNNRIRTIFSSEIDDVHKFCADKLEKILPSIYIYIGILKIGIRYQENFLLNYAKTIQPEIEQRNEYLNKHSRILSSREAFTYHFRGGLCDSGGFLDKQGNQSRYFSRIRMNVISINCHSGLGIVQHRILRSFIQVYIVLL